MDLRVEHSTRSPLAQKFHDENKFFEVKYVLFDVFGANKQKNKLKLKFEICTYLFLVNL